MEAKEFVSICKEVFPDCTIKGAAKNQHPCLRVFTSGVGYYVAHLWGKKCCAWKKSEDVADKEDYTLEELKLKLEKVKLSYGL